jgi:hypothetical protein
MQGATKRAQLWLAASAVLLAAWQSCAAAESQPIEAIETGSAEAVRLANGGSLG